MNFHETLDALAPLSVTWRVGSHLHGTAGPDSDEDFLTIYYDHADDRRVFRQFPDVAHSKDDDHKLYSLRKFAEMLEKGNPNAVEIVTAPFYSAGVSSGAVQSLLLRARPYVRHRGFYGACLGHASGVASKGETAPYLEGPITDEELAFPAAERKRVAHALRVVALGLSNSDEERNSQALWRAVKFGPESRASAYAILRSEVARLEVFYRTAQTFSSLYFKDAINAYFQQLE